MNKFEIMKEALEQIAYAEDNFNMNETTDYDCFEKCIFIAQEALSKIIENYCLINDCTYNLENKCILNEQVNDCPYTK